MRQLDPGAEIPDLLAPYQEEDRCHPDGRCWVMANMVGGLDGSATIAGRVGDLSNPVDFELLRLLRSLSDVVLVGAETVRRERYGPVRLPDHRRRERMAAGRPAVPRLAVISRSLDLDWDSSAFTGAEDQARTLVVTCEAADAERKKRAVDRSEVIVAGDQRVDLAAALDGLADLDVGIVLCEGGPSVLGELVADDLVDELCLTVSPVMGGDDLPIAVSPTGASLRRFHLVHTLVDGDSLYLRYLRAGDGPA